MGIVFGAPRCDSDCQTTIRNGLSTDASFLEDLSSQLGNKDTFQNDVSDRLKDDPSLVDSLSGDQDLRRNVSADVDLRAALSADVGLRTAIIDALKMDGLFQAAVKGEKGDTGEQGVAGQDGDNALCNETCMDRVAAKIDANGLLRVGQDVCFGAQGQKVCLTADGVCFGIGAERKCIAKDTLAEYATKSELTDGLATIETRTAGTYATKSELTDGLATKQAAGTYATEAWVAGKGYATTTQLNGKQDKSAMGTYATKAWVDVWYTTKRPGDPIVLTRPSRKEVGKQYVCSPNYERTSDGKARTRPGCNNPVTNNGVWIGNDQSCPADSYIYCYRDSTDPVNGPIV